MNKGNYYTSNFDFKVNVMRRFIYGVKKKKN